MYTHRADSPTEQGSDNFSQENSAARSVSTVRQNSFPPQLHGLNARNTPSYTAPAMNPEGAHYWQYSMGPQAEFLTEASQHTAAPSEEGITADESRYIGPLADCGQYAHGSPYYGSASIDPITGEEQPLAVRDPGNMDISHSWAGDIFRRFDIPPRANTVAYFDVRHGSFHYAKIHRDDAGLVTHLSHAPFIANPIRPSGGTARVFSPDMTLIAQRGMRPAEQLSDHGSFVDYCENTFYLGDGLYFFSR